MSSLSSVSIRRPVLAIVLSITIIIFGIIGFTRLGIREFPNVDPPFVNVSTSYVGANADVIETQITEQLEESINGIAGIKTLTSSSRDGASNISVEFNLGVDMEAAANDVRDKVARSVRSLPPDASPPNVSKADADSNPIIAINVKGGDRSLLEMSSIAEKRFKERLQTIEGVSEVRIWGEKRYSMRINMDPALLAAYQLTPLDVRNALNRENIELPSGRIEGTATELSVRTVGRLTTVEDFNNLPIRDVDGRVIKIQDIGFAQIQPENDRTILKRDGIPMVAVVVVPQPGTNQIQISEEVIKRIEEIKLDLPPDIQVDYAFDVTKYVRNSIKEVQETIFIAFGLVVIIIFVFLRNWRTTLIPVIAIPISLIGSFFIMYISGFSINVLTLLGIVLAIGLVVDDAIVVMENIYTKIENGMSPTDAALKGSSEIFFAVISTTIALAAVFLPVIFLEGLTGRLFREFGLVVAGSVIISSFVALSLTPMLCANLLKKSTRKNWFYSLTEKWFDTLNTKYESALNSFMNNRLITVVIMAVSVGLIVLFINILPKELAPLEDRGLLTLNATAPEGTSYEMMDEFINDLTQLVKDSIPEAAAVVSVTSPGFAGGGANSGFVRIILTDASERERSQQEIANFLTAKTRNMTAARIQVSQDPTIGDRRGGQGVQYVIQAPNQEKLREVLPAFLDEARQNAAFSFVDANLKFNKPEIKLVIDREKARALKVSTLDIAQTLQLGLSGQRFGFYINDGKQYQVIGQVARPNRSAPIDLKSLYVRNAEGNLIQIDNLVQLVEQSSPPQLYRYNRYVSATVSAQTAPGVTLGQGVAIMQEIGKNQLDETFRTNLAGQARELTESSTTIYQAFLLTLILIYLVLAAQFESFRDPLIIMFTVPLALVGALTSLWLFDQTFNLFSQIGIIVLVGLVTKNGILIVEFANQRKAEGMSIFDAVKQAAQQRFRPILMTSLSSALGILPIALALGAGSESRVSMGIAVVGGLLVSTFLTLFVVPVVYSILSEKTKSVSNVEPIDNFNEPELKSA